jgi:uncharacterized protein (DUF58 family)
MPTRSGWTVALASILSIAVGRVFGIVELFVIGAALASSVVVAVVVVRIHRPRLAISRWAHPSVLTVGDLGRVDLLVENRGTVRSPAVELTEPVGTSNSAHMTVAPLTRGEQVTAGYRVPAGRRGVLSVGPAMIERHDLLGLATTTTLAAGTTEITVAPRTYDLPMPSLGHGVLGRHLLALSRRLGPGEFHSLRDYVDGDEPRSIHWKASARSEGLKVRQHEAQGVRRCIVVLDRDRSSFPTGTGDADSDAFERAVTVAASVVVSAERVGLTTRFVTGGDVDLRGPDVAVHTLRTLAPLAIGPSLDEIDRDPGEGLGLIVVVTSTPETDIWRRVGRVTDPTLTRIGVFTERTPTGRLVVDATTIETFRRRWHHLAGARLGGDHRTESTDPAAEGR